MDVPEIAFGPPLKGHLRGRDREKKFYRRGRRNAAVCHAAACSPRHKFLLIGVGAADITSTPGARPAHGRVRKPPPIGAGEIAILFAPDRDPDNAAGAFVEGALLASYQFNKYRSNSRAPAELKILTLFCSGLKKTAAMQKSVDSAQAIMPAIFLARDLVNESPSVATARFLSAQAQAHCRGRGLTVECLE